MSEGRHKPIKVITLGRWSAAIFYDDDEGAGGGRYSINIRKMMSQDEMAQAEKNPKPESLLLYEEEPLILGELNIMIHKWIVDRKTSP